METLIMASQALPGMDCDPMESSGCVTPLPLQSVGHRFRTGGRLRIAAAGFAAGVSIMLGVMAAGSTPAMAQVPIIIDRDSIAVCLCLSRTVDERLREMNARRALYDRAQADVAAMQADLENSRAGVNTADPASVAAYREKVLQFDERRRAAQDSAMPDYQTAVDNYNARAGEYSQRCAGKALDPVARAEVAANLICRLD